MRQQDSIYYKLLKDSTSTKPSASWLQPQANASLSTASKTKTDALRSKSNKNEKEMPKSLVSEKYIYWSLKLCSVLFSVQSSVQFSVQCIMHWRAKLRVLYNMLFSVQFLLVCARHS